MFFTAMVLSAAAASATITGGGGSKTTDCLAVFDAVVNTPVGKPRNVRCTDGQMGCDADGVVNGVCEFQVSFCVNSTAFTDCTLNGARTVTVAHASDNGDPKFDPEFQALQTRINNDIELPSIVADHCTNTPTTFRVPIKGPLGNNSCGKRTKKVQVTTVSELIGLRTHVDKDTLKLTCVPADDMAGGCDPQTLFAGTFDRIQRQIFNQSCALSSCHDSQSQSGSLLLESGAALGNLINVDPIKAGALALGWKRVTPNSPDTSFIYHKLEGDFPAGDFGARMPFGRPKLNRTLREVIRLWILHGAPGSGWVPGTY
jgi:hypothetical protein